MLFILSIVSYCTHKLLYFIVILYDIILNCPLYLIVHCNILFSLFIVSYYQVVLRPCLALQNLNSDQVFTGLRQDGSHQSRGFEGDATASGLFRAQTPRLPGPVASRLAARGLYHGRPESPPLRHKQALRHLWQPPAGLSAGRFEA